MTDSVAFDAQIQICRACWQLMVAAALRLLIQIY